jgi:hypothetical protein
MMTMEIALNAINLYESSEGDVTIELYSGDQCQTLRFHEAPRLLEQIARVCFVEWMNQGTPL